MGLTAAGRLRTLGRMTVFSKRHRHALAEGRLQVDLAERLRVRIWRLLQRFNESFYVERGNGWNDQTDTLSDLHGELLDVYGRERLLDGGVSSLEGLVRRGPGEEVLDVVELFVGEVGDSGKGVERAANEIFSEEDSNLRLVAGEFVVLDSVFVHEQLVGHAREVISNAGFEGAAHELREASSHISDGEAASAIHSAGKAFESVMKAVLDREDGTAKQLVEALGAEGFFDGLPSRHRQGFVQNILVEPLPWMRNRLGGHGQGRDRIDIPIAYARLALGFAASLGEFLVALQMERETPDGIKDLLGVPVPAVDDDIPF